MIGSGADPSHTSPMSTPPRADRRAIVGTAAIQKQVTAIHDHGSGCPVRMGAPQGYTHPMSMLHPFLVTSLLALACHVPPAASTEHAPQGGTGQGTLGPRVHKKLYMAAFIEGATMTPACFGAKALFESGQAAFERSAFSEASEAFIGVAASCREVGQIHDAACKNAGVSAYNANDANAAKALVARVRASDEACAVNVAAMADLR